MEKPVPVQYSVIPSNSCLCESSTRKTSQINIGKPIYGKCKSIYVFTWCLFGKCFALSKGELRIFFPLQLFRYLPVSSSMTYPPGNSWSISRDSLCQFFFIRILLSKNKNSRCGLSILFHLNIRFHNSLARTTVRVSKSEIFR